MEIRKRVRLKENGIHEFLLRYRSIPICDLANAVMPVAPTPLPSPPPSLILREVAIGRGVQVRRLPIQPLPHSLTPGQTTSAPSASSADFFLQLYRFHRDADKNHSHCKTYPQCQCQF